MNTGMLWFDDSSRSLKVRVKEAVEYYSEKYGEAPTLCFVNPSMVSEKVKASNGVEVKETRIVMPGHFWLGVSEEETQKTNGRAAKSTISNGQKSSPKDEE
jgi:hypothetical protein